MATGDNMRVVQRFYDELWNKGNLDIADELFSPDFKGHAPGDTGANGPEGVKQFVATWRAAFPDLTITIDDQYEEGEAVGTRFTCRGTQTGSLYGIPPSGNAITMYGMAITHIVDGKVTSDWGEFDVLGLLMQMGIIPSGPPQGQSGNGG